MQKVNVVVFDGFELLDVFGPVGVFGGFAEEYEIKYYSLEGGIVTSAQNAELQTLPFSVMEQGILLVPGGRGTRELVKDRFFIKKLRELATEATYVISVCTGAALLAKAGILKGKKATSNQRAFDWVQQQDPEVDWVKDVRWIARIPYIHPQELLQESIWHLALFVTVMGKRKHKRLHKIWSTAGRRRNKGVPILQKNERRNDGT